jgi:hypothetical protein
MSGMSGRRNANFTYINIQENMVVIAKNYLNIITK